MGRAQAHGRRDQPRTGGFPWEEKPSSVSTQGQTSADANADAATLSSLLDSAQPGGRDLGAAKGARRPR